MNKTSAFFTAAAACLICLASCSREPAFEQQEEVGPYTVTLIEKNVWHIEDCNSDNPHGAWTKEDGSAGFNGCSDMYIVRGKDKAILIDLSNNIKWAEGADEALRSIFYARAGERQKLITITHNHGDHTGMYYAFKDEPGISYILPVNDFKNDKVFPENREYAYHLDAIDLGGDMILDCFECEGHTTGSMVFFLRGHDLAFSGDAMGSGTGVWIFSISAMLDYASGIYKIYEYINDEANGIDLEKLRFWGGHTYQGTETSIDADYVSDTMILIDDILSGNANPEPYPQNALINTTFKYGKSAIDWNLEQYEQLISELAK